MPAYDRIYRQLQDMEIIDTHEHLPSRRDRLDGDTDVLKEYLTHYFSCDLVSAGLPPADLQRVREEKLPIGEKWRMVAPYWKAASNTGYHRALQISAQKLYGIDRIDADSIEALNEGFLALRRSGNHHRRVLKETARIKIGILDSDPGCDREYFRSTVHIDGWVKPGGIPWMEEVCRRHGLSLTSFEDWLEAVDREIEGQFAAGCVCYKSALAYKRTLHYPQATLHEAQQAYRDMMEGWRHMRWEDNPNMATAPAFENYMMHHILRTANRKGRVIQFHTGIQEGNGNRLMNSDPALLTNLFLDYPDLKFDLFHMSYPFMGRAGVLAKNFPNVFIDMCWGHIISPTAAINALVEWLDAVPANKISAFGGDYVFLDGVVGHAEMARRNVAKALSIKVGQGDMQEDRAVELAGELFYDNPRRIFGLDV